MRAFHFQVPQRGVPARRRGQRAPQRRLVLLALAASLSLAGISPVHAQFPGHVHGTVTDAVTGDPVAGAVVSLGGQARSASTGSDGAFRLRSLESGAYTLSVSASGYHEARVPVEVTDGAVARPTVRLEPAPVDVEGLRIAGERRREVGAVRVAREEIRAAGANHLGEVLDGVSGVTVRSTGPGGPAEVSIRGSSADGVLVLVDGVPLNDPVTGEADLSTLPADQVEEVTVLPGGRTARFGPRARGGVILVETRRASVGVAGRAAAGSLGRRRLAGEAGVGLGPFELGFGGTWETADNVFGFRLPEEAGGGEAERRNADVRRRSARVALSGSPGRHRLRATLQVEDLRRGLPGKSFQPSPAARQDLERLRASATAVRSGDRGSRRLAASGTLQRMHQRDPDPPVGRSYEVRPRLGHFTVRAEADRPTRLRSFDLRLEAGVEGSHRALRGAELEASAPEGSTDLGLWSAVDFARADLPGEPELRVTGRLHRDGLLGDVVPAHDVTLRGTWGRSEFHLAHRSSYSPPTLGDQFFQEGVAVEPNPDLRAERVPGEWEVGAATGGTVGPVAWSADVAAFRADVEGMIVWAPDFRFIWSPRNVDVNRRGAEVRLEARDEGRGLRAAGSYTLARVTYDRGDAGDSQVIYRPRHQGSADVGWEGPRGLRLDLGGRYLGTRYPVPAEANALPAFWTFDLAVGGEVEVLDRVVEPTLRVDRLLDRRDPFVFAFPEPGRTWELSVRVRPATGGGDPLETDTRAHRGPGDGG